MSAAVDAFIAGPAVSLWLERASVVLGIAYSLLAVRRSRWCWVCGGLSSAIIVYLSALHRLPMQAGLQAYYVAVSIYGFRRWLQHAKDAGSQVTTWPLRAHAASWAVILILSLLSARWLAAETEAAWPFLDSVTTWASLLATWLVVQMKLENWLYWIAIDVVLTYLFGAQRLYLLALMFACYLCISVVGFLAWFKTYRLQAARV
ncbi:MAG TPA: nicotinamide riboside transporter PnuC [Steroidobacteraceae bacterium]